MYTSSQPGQLNRSISHERLQANYDKAEAYDAIVERLGGTYFLPALVDTPSGAECTEVIYKDGIEQPTAAVSAETGTSVDACLDAKVAAFHKESGDDAPIVHDVIEEWKAVCRK